MAANSFPQASGAGIYLHYSTNVRHCDMAGKTLMLMGLDSGDCGGDAVGC
jgi:hypothetical protein